EGDIRASAPDQVAEAYRMRAQMAALHALQNQIVACLYREMEVRHQPLLIADQPQQGLVRFDGIDRGQPQTLERGNVLQDPRRQLSKCRPTWKISAIGSQIDARKHNLLKAQVHKPARFPNNSAGANAARVAPSIRDDTERAAMVAAVLHLQHGAGAM